MSGSRSSLKSSYLAGGYLDENGKPRREIYIDWAKYIAEEFYRQGMTRASLRRFYGRVKGIQRLINNEESFQEHKHRLHPVIPFAYYAVNREDNKLPVILRDFMEKNIELASRDYEHFRAFVDHFQSVIAYFRGK